MTLVREHEQTLELLPWYVNETLVGKEAELVLRHLSVCEHCRAERDHLYQLQQLVQEADAPVNNDRKSLAGVMRRVDAAERDSQSMGEAEEFRQRRRLFPMGIAASILGVAGSAGAWLTSISKEPAGEEFQTLSSDVPAFGTSQLIALGFVNPIPAATMRQALIETHSNIVSGPDSQGNYLVEVVVPGDMSATEYLSRIKEIEGVKRARFIAN